MLFRSSESTDSLVNAIHKLFAYSEEKRNQMGKNARRLAELKFDRKKTYPRIIEMIEKLIT